jgi:hypothetical protein
VVLEADEAGGGPGGDRLGRRCVRRDQPAAGHALHDDDNPASCRVAEKAGYPFLEFSPANPPHWYTDGHIHMLQPGP